MDPNPIKHVGSMLKRIRAEIEPRLVQAGFVFQERNKPTEPGESFWLDYSKSGRVFSIRYEPRDARLVAELLADEAGEEGTYLVAVTEMNAPTSTLELQARINDLVSKVIDFLATINPTAGHRS
jgi:hypothetical protein